MSSPVTTLSTTELYPSSYERLCSVHILVSVDGFAVNDSVELGTRSREAIILRNIYMLKYEFINIIQYQSHIIFFILHNINFFLVYVANCYVITS